MLADILRFTSGFFGAMLAGGMAMELLMIIPAMRAASPRTAIEMHKGISPLGFRYVFPAILVCPIAGIALLAIESDFWDTATVLTLSGVVASLLGLAVTVALYAPVDEVMKAWPDEQTPADYEQVVERWNRVHLARTAPFVAGGACFVAAALAS